MWRNTTKLFCKNNQERDGEMTTKRERRERKNRPRKRTRKNKDKDKENPNVTEKRDDERRI
jgi:hypothetical protein